MEKQTQGTHLLIPERPQLPQGCSWCVVSRKEKDFQGCFGHQKPPQSFSRPPKKRGILGPRLLSAQWITCKRETQTPQPLMWQERAFPPQALHCLSQPLGFVLAQGEATVPAHQMEGDFGFLSENKSRSNSRNQKKKIICIEGKENGVKRGEKMPRKTIWRVGKIISLGQGVVSSKPQ